MYNLLVNKYTKDSYDYTEWEQMAELIYECIDCGIELYNLKSCYNCRLNCKDLSYCMFCSGSSHLFGCISLNKQKYCILNKQYTKSDYEALLPRVIKHMKAMPYTDKKGRVYSYGEFFPYELSPWGYNETTIQEYFPLTKSEAEKKGYNWYEPSIKKWQKETYQVPDDVRDVKDTICNAILACKDCGKNYRIVKKELAFYREMTISIPRKCPDCRHGNRVKLRNPLKLWHRLCQCAGKASDNAVYDSTVNHFHGEKHCPNEFETSYPPSPKATEGQSAPERAKIIYCEQCYLQEVA